MRPRAAALAALLVLSPAVRAQDAPPQSPAAAAVADDAPAARLDAERAARRAAAARLAGPDAAVLVLSPSRSEAPGGTHRNPDYEYLSPVAAREAAVLCAAGEAGGGGPRPRSDLYLPVRNPAGERWTGPEPGPGPETAAAARFADARPLDRLAEDVVEAMRGRRTLYVSAGPSKAGEAAVARIVAALRAATPRRWVRVADAPRDDVLESLRAALPETLEGGTTLDATLAKTAPLEIRPAREILAPLRAVKSRAEVDAIRRAVAASLEGHADAMRVARPGLFEYHLAAVLEMRCRAGGCARQAYPSIVGSGPNSCVLHYDRNRRRLEDGDLVVLDAGGEYEGYACDVTRTFPVSGRFTPEQAAAYDAVLEAQRAAIAAVRPGVTLRQVHEAAVAVLERHGLAKFFVHGTCHAVGLEVHDPWSPQAPLRAGCVITVEPGVYDASRALGVRIEDTVLVTETGCEVLSDALPKDRAAIEALMAEEPAAGLPR